MFKQLTIYRMQGYDVGRQKTLPEFVPCGPTQGLSVGFVPPRGENEALVEVIAHNRILAVDVQTRSVPPAQINDWVRKASERIEQETGRKPGKGTRRELKDQALLELLPKAFPKTARVHVWLTPDLNYLCLDTTSGPRCDIVATLVAQALNVALQPVQLVQSPASVMTGWLSTGAVDSELLQMGESCELRLGEAKPPETVRYVNRVLDLPEVKQYLTQGMRPTRLELIGPNVAFTLTDGFQFRSIKLGEPETAIQETDAFDANVVLACGTLWEVLDDLIEAHGGEVAQ